MGKKNKEKDVDQVPNPNNASNRDIIQRLNFLYQASVYLNGVGAPRPSTPAAPGDANTEKMGATESGKQGKHKRKRHRKEVINTSDLSRSYIRTMKIVGKKTTVKMCVFFFLSLHDS
jgi:ribonuclease P protein subunit RPR2